MCILFVFHVLCAFRGTYSHLLYTTKSGGATVVCNLSGVSSQRMREGATSALLRAPPMAPFRCLGAAFCCSGSMRWRRSTGPPLGPHYCPPEPSSALCCNRALFKEITLHISPIYWMFMHITKEVLVFFFGYILNFYYIFKLYFYFFVFLISWKLDGKAISYLKKNGRRLKSWRSRSTDFF